MRALAVGGAGDIGRPAAHMIVADDVATYLVVAGRNEERARSVAATLGSKVSTVEVDAMMRAHFVA